MSASSYRPFAVAEDCHLSDTSNSAAEMNAKLVVALIVTLQVSLSLCDIPEPSTELVDKYDKMRTKFISRLMNVYAKAQEAVAPVVANVGQNEEATPIKEFFENLQEKPGTQSLVKAVTDLSQELSPLVVKARLALLGLYEKYLRSTYGTTLDEFITKTLQPFLDKYMPAENQ